MRQVKSFISETEGFVEDARETLTVLTDDVHGSVDDVKGTITKFNELAESTKGLVDTANAALADVHEKIKPIDFAKTEQTVREEFVALSKRLQSTSEQFEKTAASLSFDLEMCSIPCSTLTRTLNETLEALRDVAVHLQDDPSALVRAKAMPTRGTRNDAPPNHSHCVGHAGRLRHALLHLLSATRLRQT